MPLRGWVEEEPVLTPGAMLSRWWRGAGTRQRLLQEAQAPGGARTGWGGWSCVPGPVVRYDPQDLEMGSMCALGSEESGWLWSLWSKGCLDSGGLSTCEVFFGTLEVQSVFISLFLFYFGTECVQKSGVIEVWTGAKISESHGTGDSQLGGRREPLGLQLCRHQPLLAAER